MRLQMKQSDNDDVLFDQSPSTIKSMLNSMLRKGQHGNIVSLRRKSKSECQASSSLIEKTCDAQLLMSDEAIDNALFLRTLNGCLGRVPDNFYPKMFEILQRCLKGISLCGMMNSSV